MSAPRLILKPPKGWFAAGRKVAQALALLSDEAFQLYIHLCLLADRLAGRAVLNQAELTQVLRKDPTSIEASASCTSIRYTIATGMGSKSATGSDRIRSRPV
jgi:hypothetical protein